MWNDGNLTMVGNTLFVNYDVIGESADVSSYMTFSCNEDNEVRQTNKQRKGGGK